MSVIGESITVSCRCGKKLKAPAASIGKKAKCPGCGAILSIGAPTRPIEDDLLDVAPTPKPRSSGAAESAPAAPAGKKCPNCGTMALHTAISCLKCGELFDQKAAAKKRAEAAAKKSKEKRLRVVTIGVLAVVILAPLLTWLIFSWPIRLKLLAAQNAVHAAGCPEMEFKIAMFPFSMPKQVQLGGEVKRHVKHKTTIGRGVEIEDEIYVHGLISGTYDPETGEVVAEAPLRTGIANNGLLNIHFKVNRDENGHITDAKGTQDFRLAM